MSCERGLCGSGHGPLRYAPAAAVPPAASVGANVRHQPFGRILKSGHFLRPRPTAKGGPVIVLALALPLLMMAALFALDALENWLFPPPSLPGTHPRRTPRKTSHPDDGFRAAHQPVTAPHQATASQTLERSLRPTADRKTALRGHGPPHAPSPPRSPAVTSAASASAHTPHDNAGFQDHNHVSKAGFPCGEFGLAFPAACGLTKPVPR